MFPSPVSSLDRQTRYTSERRVREMKIGRPIKSGNIPQSAPGAKRDPKYDALAEKVLSAEGKSIPIECETISEATCVCTALSRRSKDIVLVRRGLTVYASKKEAD